MKEKQTQIWIPLYVDKWIFGSTRIELEPAERGVFVDLMAFGAKDQGFIRANEITAYPHTQLAGLLNIPVDLLESTITKCIHFEKLIEPEPGIYRLKNWDKFQLSKSYVSELENGIKPLPGLGLRTKSSLERTKGSTIREDKRVEDKRKGGGEADPPTLSEVRDYREAEHLRADPDKFHHYQSSKGWPGLIDWRAAFRYWDRTEYPDKVLPAAAAVPRVNPLAAHEKAMALIEAKNAWEDKHAPKGICSFCGAAVKGLMPCVCSERLQAYNKEFSIQEAKV
jgi:hypothetical protein